MEKNKKAIIIVVSVLAVIIVAGCANYGYNRWRQQKLVNEYYQAIYGINAPTGMGGLMGGLAGGTGGLSADAFSELARIAAEEEAQADADEAEETAKTPAQKFNEATTGYLDKDTSSLFDQVARPEVESVFDDCKIIGFSLGYGVAGFAVQVMVPEKVTSESFGKLVEKFTDEGYQSAYGEVNTEDGTVMLEKGDGSTVLTLAFDLNSEEQEITVMYSTNE
ncbi:MAG: hypothetical protein WC702_01370 [Patescibacteria group bacterium]|jgi:hypothetical protein